MMRNRILSQYPQSDFKETKADCLYIADFKHRTASLPKDQQMEVTVSLNQPMDPLAPQKEMPCFVIKNPSLTPLYYNIFDDKQFVDNIGLTMAHGEGCFFPVINDGRSWFCILEIKDCKPKEISGYKENLKNKIDDMYNIFRHKTGIPNLMYFIISVPQKKISHDYSLLADYCQQKQYRRYVVITSNEAEVTDNHAIHFKI